MAVPVLLVAVDQLVFSAFVARTWSRLQKRQRMAGERGAKRGRKEWKSRRLMVIDIVRCLNFDHPLNAPSVVRPRKRRVACLCA